MLTDLTRLASTSLSRGRPLVKLISLLEPTLIPRIKSNSPTAESIKQFRYFSGLVDTYSIQLFRFGVATDTTSTHQTQVSPDRWKNVSLKYGATGHFALSGMRHYSDNTNKILKRKAEVVKRHKALQRRRQAYALFEESKYASNSPTQVEATEAPVPMGQFEEMLAPVLGHPTLCITREVEWGNVILGFEQANKYALRDASGAVVGYLAEETNSMGTAVMRQVLRKRRSLSATLFDATGRVVMRVDRPAYLVSSTIRVSGAEGAEVGEVFQRWHLFKRNYDLYVRKQQFAEIKGGFLAWDFEFLDSIGGILARVDRNFQGWGKLLFTDAGQYAMYFGSHRPIALPTGDSSNNTPAHLSPLQPSDLDPQEMRLRQLDTPTSRVEAPQQRSQLNPQDWVAIQEAVSQLQPKVSRTLSVTERAVALAAAISIDFDYFSAHSGHGGGGFMPFFMPFPIPGGGGGGGAGTEGVPPSPPPPGGEVPTGGDADGDDDDDGDDGDDDGEGGSFLGDLWDAFQDFDE